MKKLWATALTLALLSLDMTAQGTDVWPFCHNFAFAKGYPLGCRVNPDDECVLQTKSCEDLICKDIFKQFEDCGDACEENPGGSPIIVGDLTCWCLLDEPKLCPGLEFPPSRFTPRSAEKSVTSKKSGDEKIWGGVVSLQNEPLLLPVFCHDQKFSCGPVRTECERGPCGPDSCLIQGHCYWPQTRGPSNYDARCVLDGPRASSIDSLEEWNRVAQTISSNWLGLPEGVAVTIMTNGMVNPGSNRVFWSDTGSLMDQAMQDAIFEIPIEETIFPRAVVFMRNSDGTTEPDLIHFQEPTDFNLCKRPAEKPETTTDAPDTTEATGDTTSAEETTESTEATTTTECPCQCKAEDDFGRPWLCCGDEVCSGPCQPGFAVGSAKWNCSANTQNFFTPTPDYSDCYENWVAAGKVDSLSLMMELSFFLDESISTSRDMLEALNFTRISLEMLLFEQEEFETEPVNALSQLKFHTELALDVVEKLMSVDEPYQNTTLEDATAVGDEMIAVAEVYGFEVTKKAKEVGGTHFASFPSLNFYMETHLLEPEKTKEALIRFPSPKIRNGSFIEIDNMGWEMAILQAVGTTIPASKAERLFPPQSNSLRDKQKRLNAEVVSLTLQGGEGEVHKMPRPGAVRVTFRHLRQAKGPTHKDTINHQLRPGEEPTAIRNTGKCTFWNSSKGLTGEWDTSGCRLVSSNHWETVCECDHLSSFALLVDVHGYIAQSKALEVLGILFSSLSIICLAATLLILHVFKVNHSARKSISKHLCLCLMLGHLLALIFIDNTYFNMPQELCVAVGVLLHYVFLAAFAWMCIEGHHLYRLIVKVFDSARDFTRIYLVVGYGAPLVIVAITGIVTASLQDYGYADDDMCWLSSPNYIWAFMGPVLLMLVLNMVVLVAAMKVAVSSSIRQKKRKASRIKIWLRGWFSISALLGITWIFGFLYIHVAHGFAYPFVILTGCQGVFIFLTRVMFNKQIREALKESFERRKELRSFYSQSRSGKTSLGDISSSGPMWYIGSSASTSLSSAGPSRRNSIAGKKRRSSEFSEESTHEMRYLAGGKEDNLEAPPYWSMDAMRSSRNSRRGSEVLFHIPEEDY